MDGKYKAPKVFRWFEARLDSGPQNWKQYTASLLVFNTVLFIFGFLVLALQPFMPLEPARQGSRSLAQRGLNVTEPKSGWIQVSKSLDTVESASKCRHFLQRSRLQHTFTFGYLRRILLARGPALGPLAEHLGPIPFGG